MVVVFFQRRFRSFWWSYHSNISTLPARPDHCLKHGGRPPTNYLHAWKKRISELQKKSDGQACRKSKMADLAAIFRLLTWPPSWNLMTAGILTTGLPGSDGHRRLIINTNLFSVFRGKVYFCYHASGVYNFRAGWSSLVVFFLVLSYEISIWKISIFECLSLFDKDYLVIKTAVIPKLYHSERPTFYS
jgi:hypothetical protein